eukprot:TRINITY_DN35863_c0_g1_i1.p1 TRINITY_DN35863_c0_g1~~TRINITY_DN35863_c0_g1_i1.p1  ORF type:complete len:640 (+),score=144.53 TRINITY_DN35863_c0_g1_i1:74-1921(+)
MPPTIGKELMGGLWLLWAGVGTTATLSSAGLHWALVQLCAQPFFLAWLWFNVEPRNVLRSFFFFCVEMFFKHFDVAGAMRIPATGPVILAIAPHSNQFVDGIVVLRALAQRKDLGFIVAAVTMRRKYVGAMARTIGGISVERSQDLKFKGAGVVSVATGSAILKGIGTEFTQQLHASDMILLHGKAVQVAEVTSDCEIRLREPFREESCEDVAYTVEPHVDQKRMFNDVYEQLAAGRCIGIFPEGGSHDRTTLLELKAGIAIMALGAAEKFPGLKVPIVPVGLNYFKGHRFRSRVFVDIGEPIVPTQEQVERYRAGGADKRAAVQEVLSEVTQGVRAVTVQAPDYDSLQFFRLMRRLYVPQDTGAAFDSSDRFALMHTFAERYDELKDKPDVKRLYKSVALYRRILRSHNIPDYAVATHRTGEKLSAAVKLKGLAKTIALLLFFVLVSLPGVFLSFPLIVGTRVISNRKAKEAVAKSSVKLAGRDVLATWKILVSFIVVPFLHLLYTAVCAYKFGSTWGLAFFFFAPFIGATTVRASEQALNRAREARVLMWGLWSSSDGQWLREEREDLRRMTLSVIREHDWDQGLTNKSDLYRLGESWSMDESGREYEGLKPQ